MHKGIYDNEELEHPKCPTVGSGCINYIFIMKF